MHFFSYFKYFLLSFILSFRVAGAALFGCRQSRFFGLAPAPTPTSPNLTLTHRTVNILFLRDLKYD